MSVASSTFSSVCSCHNIEAPFSRIQGPKKWFPKCDKHYPSRSGQTSLATAVANFTKPRTSHFFNLCISLNALLPRVLLTCDNRRTHLSIILCLSSQPGTYEIVLRVVAIPCGLAADVLRVVAAPMAGRPRGLAVDAPCTYTTLKFKHKMNSESQSVWHITWHDTVDTRLT